MLNPDCGLPLVFGSFSPPLYGHYTRFDRPSVHGIIVLNVDNDGVVDVETYGQASAAQR